MKKLNSRNFFWLGYFLMCISDMYLTVEVISNFLDYLEIMGLVIIVIHVIYTIIKKNKLEKRKFYMFILFFFISLVSYFFSKNMTILRLLLLCLVIMDFNFDEFVYNDIKIKLILYIGLIMLNFLGLTNVQEFLRVNGGKRNTLGFVHPNALGLYTMMLIFEIVFLVRYSKKIHIYSFLCFGGALFLNKIADSRSSVIILCLLGIMLLFNKLLNKVKKSRLITFILKNSFIIATIISILLVYKYDTGNNYAIKLNQLLSNRLRYSSYYLNQYDYTLFGNFIESSNMVLDNAYLEMIIRFGIISFCIMHYINYKNFYIALNNKDDILIIILCLLMIYGLMENSVLRINYNTFLLMFYALSVKKREEFNNGGRYKDINYNTNL